MKDNGGNMIKKTNEDKELEKEIDELFKNREEKKQAGEKIIDVLFGLTTLLIMGIVGVGVYWLTHMVLVASLLSGITMLALGSFYISYYKKNK